MSNAQPSIVTSGKMASTAVAVNILKPHCVSFDAGQHQSLHDAKLKTRPAR